MQMPFVPQLFCYSDHVTGVSLQVNVRLFVQGLAAGPSRVVIIVGVIEPGQRLFTRVCFTNAVHVIGPCRWVR